MPIQTVEVVAHEVAVVRASPVPDHQQGFLEMGLERFERVDKLLLFDAALVQSEQTVGVRQAGDDRYMVPVEVKLDDGGLPLGHPCAHPLGALAYARFVDKYD